ncbi:MAG: glycine C-acetyltransferase [bacterium]
MLDKETNSYFKESIANLKKASLYKHEEEILSQQGAWVTLSDKQKYLNLCSNNYLGLAADEQSKKSCLKAVKQWGYGMASVRFICGTQRIHKELEQEIASFLHCEDSLLYSSCYDANAGLFEALLGANDAIFSDELNHACIIDGIRLCKAKRYRYKHRNMAMLEQQLKEAKNTKIKLIVTDGVFSMNGQQAPLSKLMSLAKNHNALVMIDDSHGIGVLGNTGRGTSEAQNLLGQVDLISGTFGKALGGASGGFVTGHHTLIEYLRQTSRPYLFSNSLAPPLVYPLIDTLKQLKKSNKKIEQLQKNISLFKDGLTTLSISIDPNCHAIIPIFCKSAKNALTLSKQLRQQQILAIAFAYPVVPKETPRVRLQLSAALTKQDISLTLSALKKILTKNTL